MMAQRRYDKLIDGIFYTVEVVRTGRYKSSGNTSDYYVISEQNIDEIVESANNAPQPITIDYNHATFVNSPVTPEQTVAAGYHHNWGWEKRANPDGSFSAMAVKNTEWTPKAKQFIENGEYRFISSVLAFDRAENENRYGARILGSSLVPIPNIKGMDPVVLNNAKAILKELKAELNESQEFEVNLNNLIHLNMTDKEKMNAYLNEVKAIMEDMVGEELTEENGSAFIEKAKDLMAKLKSVKKLEQEKEMAEQNAAELARQQVELMAEKAKLITELNSLREKQNEQVSKVATGFEDIFVSLLADYALQTGKITPAQRNNETTTVELNGEKKTVAATHPIKPIFKGNYAIALQECNGDTVKAFHQTINDTKAYIDAMPSVLPAGQGSAPATAKETPLIEQTRKYGEAALEVNSESVKIQNEIESLIKTGKTYDEAFETVKKKYPKFFGLEFE
jgi:phage I-like protein